MELHHKKIALIGNPNCGKTTVFNALTGENQSVGNWAGVTVEKKSGFFEVNGTRVEVVDLPGVYSLSVISSASLDERITRDFLLFDKPDLVVNIVDASNLERNLYMTLQLAEMNIPVILVMNMMDTAKKRHMEIDLLALSQELRMPVIPVVAAKNKGIKTLKEQIALQGAAPAQADIPYAPAIESAVSKLIPFLEERSLRNGWNVRWLAVHLLDGDTDNRLTGSRDTRDYVQKMQEEVRETAHEDADTLIADSRYHLIGEIAKKVLTRSDRLSETLSEVFDRVALGKWTGIPFFLLVMYLMFVWTISLGDLLIDPIGEWTEKYFVDEFAVLLERLGSPEMLTVLLTKGAGQGVSTVATFIPPIAFLFIFLTALEDSGYMARAAFVTDRLMRALGLPGTAFVPMIIAFGCTVPAIMSTRTLTSYRDRLMTLVMTPFMSCGARMPVYALFAGAFFGAAGSNIVFALYLTGILTAIATGLLMKHTILRGEPVPLILELPPYHVPTLRNVAYRTWDKLHGFIVRAGSLIIPLVVVLNVLNSVDFAGNFGNVPPESSVLANVGKQVTPLLKPTGITPNNWPATVGLMTGVMAKEAVIGTLDSVYGALSDSADSAQRLVSFFDGKTGAFAYLLFVLLYMPCLAALGTIFKEFGAKWTAFTALWTTGQAYCISTLFYQIATFSRHPSYSAKCVIAVLTLELTVCLLLKFIGNKREAEA